jgi:hypothetical protein
MPDRHKLSTEVFQKVTARAPARLWIAVMLQDGKIIGVGPTRISALHNARTNHPQIGREQVALIWNDQKG